MSTLRISNIEAKANGSSPSVDEKLKFTNSSGDVLVHVDGKTSGITTIGFNTTGESLRLDNNNNIYSTGIITATKFSGIIDATTATFSGDVSIGGTLTYQDVTNIDSVGIITARSDIRGGRNLNVTGLSTFSDHIRIVDGKKLLLGSLAAGDCQFIHDGNGTFIQNKTGDLKIANNVAGDVGGNIIIQAMNGENSINCVHDAQVELSYNGTKRISTSGIGVTVTGTIDLDAISTTISDTAVDLFVYDTRKDSDGGAWRKRTSHTSWYNEAFGTKRGSKKEFPAVAVIVVIGGTVGSYGNDNGNNKIKIYDADDPTMPLWMEFEGFSNTNNLLRGATNYPLNGVYALNGTMCFTRNGGYGMGLVSFIDEKIYSYWDTSSRAPYKGSIADRNSGKGIKSVSGYGLANATTTDVAMTILPNAPIDDGTRLPTPTIAVSTLDGVTIIDQYDKIIDYERSGGNDRVGSLTFDENNDLIVAWGTSGSGYRHIARFTEPFAADSSFDTNQGYLATDLGLGASAGGAAGGAVKLSDNGRVFAIDHDSTGRSDVKDRLGLLHLVDESPAKSLGAFINSSSNSGWCVGDITRAWLCSTDTTNATGSDKITGGIFSNQTMVNAWTGSGGTLSLDGGQLRVTSSGSGPASGYQAVTLVVGKRYTVTSYIHNASGTSAQSGARIDISTGTTVNNPITGGSSATIPANNAYPAHLTFTATATTMYVHLTSMATSASRYSVFDFVILREAEEDMSLNNKGIFVYGTVTKTAVASGAELVSYGGFSGSNYLQQQYSADFNYGTTDYSVSLWFKSSAGSATEYLFRKGNPTDDHGIIEGYITQVSGTNGKVRFVLKDAGSSDFTLLTSTDTWNDGLWHHYVGVRESGLMKLYLDGRLNTSAVTDITHSVTWGGMSELFGIGTNGNGGNPASNTELTLVKVSGDAPTDEQVKKIYNDEKKLFEPNAKCTLYGSSDTVTAVAYDDSTDTAYAGTSAGRSDFVGLNRINNTTTAVTAAISASNGLVVDE